LNLFLSKKNNTINYEADIFEKCRIEYSATSDVRVLKFINILTITPSKIAATS
jgi:hypothetical protein